MDLDYYLRLAVRRLPYVIVLVTLGTVAGLSIAARLPPTYRAEAVLLVESAQIPTDLAVSTVRTNEREQVEIIRQRLQTRNVLLDLANRLDIYANTEERLTPDQKMSDLRDRIRISINNRGASLVTVSFDARSRSLAENVASEIVTLMLQENVRIRTTAAGQTLDFFDQEVERLEANLSQVSEQILAFQENNLQALPDSLNFRRSQQSGLQERAIRVQRDLDRLQDRRDRLVTLYESTNGAAFTAQAQMTREESRLRDLEREYTSQLALLSPNNPRMVVMRSQLEALEGIVAQQRADAGQVEGDGALGAYELQLADLDNQIGYLTNEAERIDRQMANLNETIEATPENAIILQTLERSYSNLQAQYNQAVASRARAETGDIIESLSKGQRIIVLEQANAPSRPQSPNRPLIAAGGMGGGLALALVVIVLMELLNSAIRRPQEITRKLGVDVFATIPYIRTRREIWKRRVVVAAVVVAVIVGLPAGVWWVDTRITPVDQLLERVLSRIDIAAL